MLMMMSARTTMAVNDSKQKDNGRKASASERASSFSALEKIARWERARGDEPAEAKVHPADA